LGKYLGVFFHFYFGALATSSIEALKLSKCD